MMINLALDKRKTSIVSCGVNLRWGAGVSGFKLLAEKFSRFVLTLWE